MGLPCRLGPMSTPGGRQIEGGGSCFYFHTGGETKTSPTKPRNRRRGFGSLRTRAENMRLKWAQVSVAVVLVTLAIPMARADVRILSSSGGEVGDYLRIFAQLRASGERIIIDGPCLSACTLVLSTIPKNRICVTRRAVLGFHAPKYVDPRSGRMSRSPQATRIVTQSYPAGVRAWIKKRGGLTGKLIYLRGRELGSLYRRC
jgi:hypothetical protein